MLDIRDFGAKGDFTTDDSTAIQTAIDTCHNGGTVIFPPTNTYYLLRKPLLLKSRVGIRLMGECAGYGVQTGIAWGGPSNVPLITLLGCRSCVLEHLNIVSSPNFPLAEVVHSETLLGTVSTGHRFRGVMIEGTNRGGLSYGYRFIPGTNGDRNNDIGTWQDCYVSNYSEAAFSIEHMQSCQHSFLNCGFSGGAGLGKHGVRLVAGSFNWLHGAGGNCTQADFHIQQPSRPISILGFDGENSARLLTTGGPANFVAPITLENVRWPGDNVAIESYMIDYRFRGPLVVTGSQLGAASSNTTIPRIRMVASAPTVVRVTGNVFGRTGSSLINPIIWNVPSLARGTLADNIYVDASGIPVIIPESLI